MLPISSNQILTSQILIGMKNKFDLKNGIFRFNFIADAKIVDSTPHTDINILICFSIVDIELSTIAPEHLKLIIIEERIFAT